MSRKASRRQWLLGLVGGMFGAGATQALDRVLPKKEQVPQATSTQLCWVRRDKDESYSQHSVPLRGKVEIEPEAGGDLFTLKYYDEQSRSVRSVVVSSGSG